MRTKLIVGLALALGFAGVSVSSGSYASYHVPKESVSPRDPPAAFQQPGPFQMHPKDDPLCPEKRRLDCLPV